MDWFTAFKFLHILAMFAAVTVAVSSETLVHRLAHRGDVGALRAVGPYLKAVPVLAPVLFLSGLAFGLLAAYTGPLDFLRPWLIASYIVFAFVFVVAGMVGGAWGGSVMRAAMEPSGGADSPAFRTALADRRGTFALYTSYVGVTVLIYLMVVKPGG